MADDDFIGTQTPGQPRSCSIASGAFRRLDTQALQDDFLLGDPQTPDSFLLPWRLHKHKIRLTQQPLQRHGGVATPRPVMGIVDVAQM